VTVSVLAHLPARARKVIGPARAVAEVAVLLGTVKSLGTARAADPTPELPVFLRVEFALSVTTQEFLGSYLLEVGRMFYTAVSNQFRAVTAAVSSPFKSLRPHSDLKGTTGLEPSRCEYFGGYIPRFPYEYLALHDGWCAHVAAVLPAYVRE
jgi:hypothetical protein